MIVTQHAVRKYKRRIGHRTSSKKRVVDLINKGIEKNTIKREYNKKTGQVRIKTDKFTAVCDKNRVVTILFPDHIKYEAK